jgi:hypothetical protein
VRILTYRVSYSLVLPSCNPYFSSPRNLAQAVVLLTTIRCYLVHISPGTLATSTKSYHGFFSRLREILGL